tara:strand:+ start:241 stop:606 length:366 start_codon:yes stop_codon:yes gene_type:complete
MANPNIVAVTSILGLSTQASLTSTLTTQILACASDKLIKVNSIIIANTNASATIVASVAITKSGGSPLKIASTVDIPADSTLIVIDKNSMIYLNEGDNIEAGTASGSDGVITISYEILDDA